MTGQVVEVQVHLSNGLPGMTIVGLPDTSINESRDRVRSAVVNSGFEWPSGRITVGLSPAFEHKRGSGLDLAVAMAVLAGSADRQVDRSVFVRETQSGPVGRNPGASGAQGRQQSGGPHLRWTHPWQIASRKSHALKQEAGSCRGPW
jgi:predicted ATPase with chaperone activity